MPCTPCSVFCRKIEAMTARIVFSHGNSFPASTYRVLFDSLRQRGFKVDAVEKFGHDPKYPVTNNWPHLVEQLADLSFADVAHNAVFIGGPGTGKTHLAIERMLGFTMDELRGTEVMDLVHPEQREAAQEVEDMLRVIERLPAECRTQLCLTEPLEYPALISLLARSHFCLTDSGGIQEEASALHKPVLILRESTERQELVQAGGARLVGTMAHQIIEHASDLLRDPVLLASMQLPTSPFGDGLAAQRIAEVLCRGDLNLQRCERMAA